MKASFNAGISPSIKYLLKRALLKKLLDNNLFYENNPL
jgi:hypothetical protein